MVVVTIHLEEVPEDYGFTGRLVHLGDDERRESVNRLSITWKSSTAEGRNR